MNSMGTRFIMINRIARLSIVFLSILSCADSGVAGMTKYLRSVAYLAVLILIMLTLIQATLL